MRNVRLILAFDGTAYHGWQIQQSQPTVQGTLQKAIQKITGEKVTLIGSGRTDAGTHARALAANFLTSTRIPSHNLTMALNSVLPRDIRVISARRVPMKFHAQHDARSKVYRYQIYRGALVPPHLAREHYHYPYPLELRAMAWGAKLFVGAHDFASFAAKAKRHNLEAPSSAHACKRASRSVAQPRALEGASRQGIANTVRHVFRSELKSRGRRLLFTVEADGFLHHMVRNMVGTMLELGRGRMSPVEFKDLFRKRDRNLAGFTAPAHGLILLRVRY